MSIHQEITIKAAPDTVYELLLSSHLFSKMSGGAPAEISGQAGGKISLFGGKIVGLNVELVTGRRVVQVWRATDWPEGCYSIVRFELSRTGEATLIVFDQAGQPDGADEHLEAGWHKMYWDPMKSALSK